MIEICIVEGNIKYVQGMVNDLLRAGGWKLWTATALAYTMTKEGPRPQDLPVVEPEVRHVVYLTRERAYP